MIDGWTAGETPVENAAAICMLDQPAAITLDGLEIANIDTSLMRIAYSANGSGSITVTNCWFHDLSSSAAISGSCLFEFRRSFTVRESVFERISAQSAASGLGDSQGILGNYGNSLTVARSVFRDIDISGGSRFSVIAFNAGPTMLVANSLFHGIRSDNGDAMPCAAIGGYNGGTYARSVRNCTFHGCDAVFQAYFKSQETPSTNTLENCSVSDCGVLSTVAFAQEYNRFLSLRNTNLYRTGEGRGYSTNASVNVTSFDPRYRNAAAGNFVPRASSPLVDAGDNAVLDGVADYIRLLDQAGTPRFLDGDFDGTATVDIGAYELVPISGGTIILFH